MATKKSLEKLMHGHEDWYEAKIAAEKLHLSVDTLKRRAKSGYYSHGRHYYRAGSSDNAKYIFNVAACREIEMKNNLSKRPSK